MDSSRSRPLWGTTLPPLTTSTPTTPLTTTGRGVGGLPSTTPSTTMATMGEAITTIRGGGGTGEGAGMGGGGMSDKGALESGDGGVMENGGGSRNQKGEGAGGSGDDGKAKSEESALSSQDFVSTFTIAQRRCREGGGGGNYLPTMI